MYQAVSWTKQNLIRPRFDTAKAKALELACLLICDLSLMQADEFVPQTGRMGPLAETCGFPGVQGRSPPEDRLKPRKAPWLSDFPAMLEDTFQGTRLGFISHMAGWKIPELFLEVSRKSAGQ